MTDREYEEFLIALSKKYLRGGQPEVEGPPIMRADTERLMNTSRLLRAVHQRAERGEYFVTTPNNSVPIYQMLGHEIQYAPTDSWMTQLHDMGMMDALDDSPELLLANLRSAAIPKEEPELLRRCGVEDAEAEITLLIHKARSVAPSTIKEVPSEVLAEATQVLRKTGTKMQLEPPPAQAKKRKILNGVGSLLMGLGTIGGNALLVTGSIVAPNPAIGFPAIGSAALGVGAVFKGLGDLRGE